MKYKPKVCIKKNELCKRNTYLTKVNYFINFGFLLHSNGTELYWSDSAYNQDSKEYLINQKFDIKNN